MRKRSIWRLLAERGRPRHAGFALPRPLTAEETVRVQSTLMAVPGVVVARVDGALARAWVGYRTGATHARALGHVLENLGFPPRHLPEGEALPTLPRNTCC